MTPREQKIADEMRRLLEFIAKGDALTTNEGRVGHAYQTVGWAKGAAETVLKVLGEQDIAP